MKRTTFTLLLMLSGALGFSQTKKVLLEEFTGVHCGQCPMGSYILDSLLQKYPNLIGVSLHTYNPTDALHFLELDTIASAYGTGAPLGATDRIYWGANVAETQQNWDARVQTRLAVPPALTVSINATWNSTSRNISAQLTTDILSDMPAGDYRFNLYIVEDSVTGTGAGYDQINFYNTVVGNPFYGMGDPIVGYVHRHVVRAILPQEWGEAGIIPLSPTNGQNFSTNVNYVLPLAYDENQVNLVAFVSKITNDHMGDTVLNATEATLPLITAIKDDRMDNNLSIYPNPSAGLLTIDSKLTNAIVTIYNMLGEAVYVKSISKKTTVVDLSAWYNGVYFISFNDGKSTSIQKIVLNKSTP